MTALHPYPRPENPEKGENPQAAGGGAGFPPFLPFPAPGRAQNSNPTNAYAAALAAVRSYRRTPPPEPPKLPRASRRRTKIADALAGEPTLRNVPRDWCEGVARLATMPVPMAIAPPRWADFASTSARLLHTHGAALHEARWGTLDVWGLHAIAPAANPSGWGLAWLLSTSGEVLDVGPDAVGMCRGPDGARLAFYRRAGARGSIVPAWKLA